MLDTPQDLLQRIRLGEDSVLELKAVAFKGLKLAGPSRDDLADELAAMANTRAGILVLGVDDKSLEITGIPIEQLDQVETFARQVCNDSIHPALPIQTIRMELPDSLGELRPVLKIDVPRSLYVHRSPGGYLHRIGSSRRVLQPDQLARLFQQRSQALILRFDEQAVPGTSRNDVDMALVARLTGLPATVDDVVLQKLKVLTLDDAQQERLSVGGALFATPHPERWLSGASIMAVRYRGNRPDSNYQIDAHEIVGPLDAQIRQAMQFVKRNMSVAATKAPDRREWPQYSDRAVFEAIVNAIVHRDYSVYGSRIRLFMFDDRLELYSPGTLPNTVTIDSMPLRQVTRNELLASLLGRCPVDPDTADGIGRGYFMEKRGEGVPLILAESEALSQRAPEFRLIDDAELRLTLWAAAPPSDGGEQPAP